MPLHQVLLQPQRAVPRGDPTPRPAAGEPGGGVPHYARGTASCCGHGPDPHPTCLPLPQLRRVPQRKGSGGMFGCVQFLVRSCPDQPRTLISAWQVFVVLDLFMGGKGRLVNVNVNELRLGARCPLGACTTHGSVVVTSTLSAVMAY